MIGRIPVVDVRPAVDCGRRPVKAVVGEPVPVSATVFREGHGAVRANVVLRGPDGRRGPWTPLCEPRPGTDRWTGEVVPDREGRWTFTVEGWADPVATWRREAGAKVPAGVDVELVLEEGAELLDRAAAEVPKKDGRPVLLEAADALRDRSRTPLARLAAATGRGVAAVLERYPLREQVTPGRPMPLQVDRERALFGSWYEFFPRSEGAVVDPSGAEPPVPGTLRSAARRLPAVAAMGFDVVYLPPVHPIGTTHRKGPGNSLQAGPHDVGSPWAIGGPAGGHDAVHPELGTFADFDAFVAGARALGMEVALDFALQCSPDHPWLREHPEWFHHRPDGSVACAENPPKTYEDIHPLNFDRDPEGLIAETVRLLRLWMDHGVRIFRVDNPHTKPVAFWEKVLADIRRTDPDVLFLAEAFTRPAVLHALAKAGFHQSYTYFTWRNGKQELTDYLTELSRDTAAFLRPNLFANTPDILPGYLRDGGPAAFAVRAVLGALLSPSWGVYSGFELFENTAAEPGGEEYRDSEKYQLRPRDWAAAEAGGRTLAPLLTLLNRLRRRHPALRLLRNLRFHTADDDAVLAFSKRLPGAAPDGGDDTVLCVVNLDPHRTREATVSLDLPALGLPGDDTVRLEVRDALTGDAHCWGRRNFVRLDPDRAPAHVFTARGLTVREADA